MPKAFRVDAKPYAGIDLKRIASEELFKTATIGLNAWKANLSSGIGASGKRRPWVNTGEARANITINPLEPGSLEYLVGGRVIQLFIAEYGRAPGNSPPPQKPIEDWVHEKRIAVRGTPEFDRVVHAIRMSIARKGIRGFAPGFKAGRDSIKGQQKRLRDRMRQEVLDAKARADRQAS